MAFFNVDDYADLAETGYGAKQAVDPKDEFFHSLYISGVKRQNEAGIVELPDKLQVRGLSYNLEEIYGIIVHIKQVLFQEGPDQKMKCFSYRVGDSGWKGLDGYACPTTSAKRAADQHCTKCKTQLIVAFLYTDVNGTPIVKEEDGMPQFYFIRGKGWKYHTVDQYISDLSKREDLEPLVDISTPKGQAFEKEVIRHKRFVTKISRTTVEDNRGKLQNVFAFEAGAIIAPEDTQKILNLSTKIKIKAKLNAEFKDDNGNCARLLLCGRLSFICVYLLIAVSVRQSQ
jgi:hypothetical protein